MTSEYLCFFFKDLHVSALKCATIYLSALKMLKRNIEVNIVALKLDCNPPIYLRDLNYYRFYDLNRKRLQYFIVIYLVRQQTKRTRLNEVETDCRTVDNTQFYV